MQTLSQLIEQYLEMCKYERNLSPDTLEAYQIDLRQFSEFTNQAWADHDALNSYINYLNMRFAPRSVKRKLASVRAFYHELEYNGVLEENPFHKLHIRIQSPKELPRTIPAHLISHLLQSAYDAYSTGNREFCETSWYWNYCLAQGLSAETFQLGDSQLQLLVNGKG